MACCSDIVSGAAANVLPSLLKWFVQEVKLVISLPQSFRDMDHEVEALNNLVNDINVELRQLQRNPKSVVRAWLGEAGGAIEQSQSIRRQYEQHKNCLNWCPNYVCRYRISRRIRDWKASVAQLQSQRQSNFPPSGEYGDPAPRTQVPVQNSQSGFVANTRRSAQTENVERWLTDEDSNIRRIGIIGIGGVGKTSLLHTINNSEKVSKSFDLIIKVTVSKNPNILQMQNCVADRLKLKEFPDKSNFEGRKYMLQSYLKNKKYLVLLDDMWAVHMWTSDELQDLGVSLDDTGFKIVLTTRDKEVCSRMHVDETIKVEPLLEEEGWQLFRSKAFQSGNGSVPHDIEEVARKIAMECKGLPLAIIVVAAAMAHHTELDDWEKALTEMRNVDETFYDLHAGVDKKLFERLQWSYNALEKDYLKSCFLYFAAYPEDMEIKCEDLIDMWICEGLVKGSGDSYLHDKGHKYIKHLLDRSLIEPVRNDEVGRVESVKIHDVLRDLAIRIAEKEHKCYFKAGVGVSQFPSEEDLQDCTKLSLISSNLRSLPAAFSCSSLSVLLLRNNLGIEEVPEYFLREVPSLRVLDLSRTGIKSLPPTIGNLKHLSSLNLERCMAIRELPESIGDLKELQFLNVSHCGHLRCLPESISQLKRLRALDISVCVSLGHLPRGISELVSLERLQCRGIALDFEEEEEALDAERKKACIKDLRSLTSLRVFWEVGIKSAVKEGVMRNWSKMRSLSLSFEEAVGQDYLPQDMQGMKDLESFFLHRCDVERLPGWVTQFRKLAYLSLWECKQLKELPAELPCLRTLEIHGCSKLEALELGMGFPKLQVLGLGGLESLECMGPVGAASGSGGLGPLPPMLKSLRVGACPKWKRLRGGWDKLKCLEEIEGHPEWWDAIEWDEPTMKTSLDGKFKSIFSENGRLQLLLKSMNPP